MMKIERGVFEMGKIESTIHKVYGELSSKNGNRKIFANISWGDGTPKDEIRMVFTNSKGEECIAKGIALTVDEQFTLYKLLKDKFENTDEDDNDEEDDQQGVDLHAIYAESSGILEKRRDGFCTKDGFTVLTDKKKY